MRWFFWGYIGVIFTKRAFVTPSPKEKKRHMITGPNICRWGYQHFLVKIATHLLSPESGISHPINSGGPWVRFDLVARLGLF